MDHIRTTKMKQAREVERLVQKGPYKRVLAKPPEAARKSPIDGNEGNRITLVSKLISQSTGLNPLASEDIQAGRDQRDSWTDHAKTRTIGCQVACALGEKVLRALLQANRPRRRASYCPLSPRIFWTPVAHAGARRLLVKVELPAMSQMECAGAHRTGALSARSYSV